MPSSSDSQRNLLWFSFYHTCVCSAGFTYEVWEMISGLFIIFFSWSLLPCVLTTHIWTLVIIQLGVLLYLPGAEERNLTEQHFKLRVNLLHSYGIDDFLYLIRAASCSSFATSLIHLICFMSIMSLSICFRLFFSPSNAFPLCLPHVFFLTGGWDEQERLNWKLHNPFSWF